MKEETNSEDEDSARDRPLSLVEQHKKNLPKKSKRETQKEKEAREEEEREERLTKVGRNFWCLFPLVSL